MLNSFTDVLMVSVECGEKKKHLKDSLLLEDCFVASVY